MKKKSLHLKVELEVFYCTIYIIVNYNLLSIYIKDIVIQMYFKVDSRFPSLSSNKDLESGVQRLGVNIDKEIYY